MATHTEPSELTKALDAAAFSANLQLGVAINEQGTQGVVQLALTFPDRAAAEKIHKMIMAQLQNGSLELILNPKP